MIISMRDVWDKAVGRHHIYVKRVIADALLSTSATPVTSPTLRALLTEPGLVETLAIGKPDKLKLIVDRVELERKKATEAERNTFDSEAEHVFDYGAFSDKDREGWNAYELCRLSRYRLCPYCQQAFAFTVVTRRKPKLGKRGKLGKPGSKRGFRPTLDHYYPKSLYPYLGLSLYNLVPACQVCNSSLKSRTDFYAQEHLHPLRDDECLTFELGAKAYLQYRQRPTAGLELQVVNGNAQLTGAAEASIETFMLNKRYGAHTLELARWIESVRHWTPEEICRRAAQFGATDAESITRFEAMLFNFDRRDHRHEMLGRIKVDLYNAVHVASPAMPAGSAPFATTVAGSANACTQSAGAQHPARPTTA